MNLKLAIQTIQKCVDLGTHEFCLCAGARNAPLVMLLGKAKGIKVYHFFEERSAAFFALGRIKTHGHPVAVVTTSGTAAAELLPAAIEATYSGLPLLLITADRPRSFRGSGAPQAIEQVGLFSKYVEICWDLETTEEELRLEDWTQSRPLQINLCFNEPLIDGKVESLDFDVETAQPQNRWEKVQASNHIELRPLAKPIAVVGALKSWERPQVVEFLKSQKIPVYAEAISGLRGNPRLNEQLLASEASVAEAFAEEYCHSVLRIGGVPTLRFWRDLEDKFAKVPVISCSSEGWTGLSRPSNHLMGLHNLSSLKIEGMNAQDFSELFERDRFYRSRLLSLLDRHPNSEVALISKLSNALQGQAVYLGNSLPIREWDLVSSVDNLFHNVEANRGANGIEGQVSTFLGWTAEGPGRKNARESWALLGDLTSFYDQVGLWCSTQIKEGTRRIVVINNGGGRIFHHMFKDPVFVNEHSFSFQKWAHQWGWDYERWTDVPVSIKLSSSQAIIELVPDLPSSDRFWAEYRQ